MAQGRKLAMKSPRRGMTSTSHTVRAMMSQEPDKRVVAVVETTAPLALFLSVSDKFIHLSLTSREEKLHDAERGFCHPQQYHIILPSRNRSSKHHELPNFGRFCTFSC